MGKYGRIAATLGLVIWLVSTVSAEPVYDVDGDGKEGLVEAVHALQVVSGLTPPLTLETYTNSIGMQFRLLPAGTYTMGSPDDEPSGHYTERPEHQVTLTKSFYMQTKEVTQAQWNTLIVANSLGTNPSSFPGEYHPVERVNWYEAASFANWLSYAEGKMICYTYDTCSGTIGTNFECTNVQLEPNCTGYRLPTEAEWEYAARATTTTAWPYAENYDTSADPGQVTDSSFNSNLDTMGWYAFNNEGGDLSRDVAGYPNGTKPVARKQANKWGLYDMQGNVWEWCQDWYDDYSGNVTDPQGPIDPSPTYGSARVIRGGCWFNVARSARSAYRTRYTSSTRSDGMGFRLVLPPGQ